MRLFTLLSGYVLIMLGTILAIHYDFTIGVLVSASGLFMFWAMLPMFIKEISITTLTTKDRPNRILIPLVLSNLSGP